MKKSGRQKKSNRRRKKVDRISNLPDSLIQHILSFLPSTRSAIRTGILSKRWRNQWRQVPVLTFHDEGFKDIENVLNQYECSKVEKFHISPYYDESFIGNPEFGNKIGLAIRRDVKELIVDARNIVRADRLRLPEFLFSYSLLVKLKTTNCILNPTEKVNWKHLKEFSAYGSEFPDRAIEHVLSGCPLLESLYLNCCRVFHFAIVSKSLRKLSVEGCLVSEIGISCPNLEELCLVEVPVEFRMEPLSGLDVRIKT